MNILTVNLLLSTLIFWIAARLYLLPRLNQTRPQAILLPVLLLHSFRHLGLMFLAPGATYAGIPPQFAYPAAYGDLLAAILALLSIRAVATGIGAAGLSSGRSTWKDRLICSPPLHWRRFITPRTTWDLRTGFPPSGFPLSWSLTTSHLSSC